MLSSLIYCEAFCSHYKNTKPGACKTVQPLQVLATKTDNPSSVPQSHMVEGKNELL